MGVRPSLLALLLIAAAAGAVGHAAAAAGSSSEAAMVRLRPEAGKVQTETLCCTNMTGYHECVVACFDYYPREQADKICDPGCQEAYQCRPAAGGECPGEHRRRSSDLLTDSGEVQAAVATTLCCSNMTVFHECVEDCFAYFPREQADKICDPGCQEAYQCRTVSGDKCPSEHRRSPDLLTGSGEVQAATTFCCSNMKGFHECVEDCFAYFPREQADKICDPGCQEAYQCRTVSGDKCPNENRSSDLLTNSGKGNSVENCMSGCKSSVCSKMVTGVGSKCVAVKRRCNNACYKFCTKGRLPAAGTSATA